ncbi:Uncharacterised protein [Enterobacter hormaechei]|nr:Uncharacterised protein [Enterobacter hormaechei]
MLKTTLLKKKLRKKVVTVLHLLLQQKRPAKQVISYSDSIARLVVLV